MATFQKFIPSFVLALIIMPQAFAQKALGEWSTHLPYHHCIKVVKTENKVYCSAEGGLFYYDLVDNSLVTLSKIDSLSDNGVSAMNYDQDRKLLILAYTDANLDLISASGIINIPDIMKKQILGDKSVYDVNFVDNLAYLSCGFGIVVINLDRLEIKDTYSIGDQGTTLKVNQTTTDGTYLYAASDEGIRKARLDNPLLIDYNSWEKIQDIPNSDGVFGSVAYYKGNLFAVYNDPVGEQDILYYNTGGEWREYPGFTGQLCNELRVSGDYLIIVQDTKASLVADNLLVVKEFVSKSPASADLGSNLDFWIADMSQGLVHDDNGELINYIPDGPYFSKVFRMNSADGVVYSVGGGISNNNGPLYRVADLETYSDNNWKSSLNYDFRDLVDVVIDPNEPGHLFAASFGYGLIEYRDNEVVTIYNEDNSSLQSIIPGEPHIRIGGLEIDSEGNVWMTNLGVAEAISVRKADGTWKSFVADNLISNKYTLGDIIITQTGDKWVVIPKSQGLFVMHDNGTIDNTEDDEYIALNVMDKNDKVIANQVFSIAEDQNGTIWVGTDQGILVYYSPGGLFTDGDVYAQEIIVPRNDGTDYGDPLLYTEKITTIKVDGANRKWIGTEGGGVFLVSANGKEQIYNFNVTNSPLLSNNILDITINDENGEVFFGTENGIISFKGEATGGSTYYDNIKIYPNPVRESYTGDIAISGLLTDSKVKITDVSGNLVFETTSLGGQAIWDGNNFFGERVATGIYLVFVSGEDGLKAAVAKILFIH